VSPDSQAPAPAVAPPAAAPAPAIGAASNATAAPAQPVDVEAVLSGLERSKGGPSLNWRSSIVDLMKLLDLDSSLDNRKQLATELGYTGAKDGSAEMNLWLHRRVMEELERNGGRVPATMTA
jgi:3-oxoacyl-ACP reductase-like protein